MTPEKLAKLRWSKPGARKKESARRKLWWAQLTPEQRSSEMKKRRQKGLARQKLNSVLYAPDQKVSKTAT